MTKLSVNVNKVAYVRNTRELGIPSVIWAAEAAVAAGAHGITVHPRPDQRHIRPGDVIELAPMLTTVEFNIEGNPFEPPMMDLVRRVRPTQATLVPDDPAAVTSDHGWNVAKDADRLAPVVRELRDLGVRVSLFMDPDVDQIRRAGALKPDRIELYTEPYARAWIEGRSAESLAVFAAAAREAAAHGLGVNAGHDLNLDNLGAFVAEVPGVLEVSIGHALIADALKMGLASAVKAYLAVLGGVRA